jgi:YHS domain-containing protein
MRVKVFAFTTVAAVLFAAGMPLGAKADINGDPYTLDVCSVSGEKLGANGEPIVRVSEGREVRFCSEACVGKFEDDKAKYFSIIDELAMKQQRANYPFETCIVSGNRITASVIDVLVYGRLVRYCCPNCLEAFSVNPDEYLAKLDRAVIAKQSKNYPVDVCLVSGEKLGDHGDVVNLVLANRLVKLCRPECAEEVNKEPARFLATLDAGAPDAR